MHNLRDNLISYLSKKYHGLIMDDKVDFKREDSDGSIVTFWAMIAFATSDGVKHRAIAIPNLGRDNNHELVASCCTNVFSQINNRLRVRVDNSIRRTQSPISNDMMPFSLVMILYTNILIGTHDDLINTFQRYGHVINILNEAEMHKTVFISYGGPDENIAKKINLRLNGKGIATWFFPRDSVPGDKLHRTMHEGINKYDRVLFFCSKSSLNRSGVLNELERVLEREAREGGSEILVPVALDDFVFSEWKPSREDLAQQIRSRVVARILKRSGPKFNEEVERICSAFKK